MNKLFCLSVLAVSFAACNSGTANYKVANPSTVATPSLTAPITPVSAAGDSVNNLPVTTPATQTNNAAASGKVNPAHGVPGHRCDIPEGAPLNSAAVTNTTNSAAPVSQPQPAKSNVRLNPAHGAPGHDCAVAVGQPLKS
jgi:hypothetical protein